MDARPKIVPEYDAPFSVAVNDLTGFEYIGIQKHFGNPFEKLSAAERVIGVVWALKNRDGQAPWSSVTGMSMTELAGYFPPEPDGDDPKAQSGTTTPES
jgi:hypothetical protein